MASQCLFYPLRSVICCVAKAHLTVAPETYGASFGWDEALFTELVATLLQPMIHPSLMSGYQSRDAAAVAEGQLAKSIVDAYRRIMQQRQNERIQQLNTLL